jgi:hypothetical protein
MEDAFTGQDPLADTPETPASQETSEAEGQPQTEETSGGLPPTYELDERGFIPGTSFKDVNGLVKSYKEIQRVADTRHKDLQQAQDYMQKMAQALLQRNNSQEQAKGAPGVSPDKFWEAFAGNPTGVLQSLVQHMLQQQMGQFEEKLQPIQNDITTWRNNSEIDGWIRNHPEFSEQDERDMVELLQSNPHIMSSKTRLDDAYDKVLAQRYRAGRKQSSSESAVADVKQVAGLGGKRSAIPPQSKGDPFDEVLDLDRTQREIFKLGKK